MDRSPLAYHEMKLVFLGRLTLSLACASTQRPQLLFPNFEG